MQYYRFAGINFCVEPGIGFRCFDLERFRAFEYEECIPDVSIAYTVTDSLDSSTLSQSSSRQELAKLLGTHPDALPRYMNDEILQCRQLHKLLKECSSHSEALTVQTRSDSVTVLDFQRKSMNVFYSSKTAHNIERSRIGSVPFSFFLCNFMAVMVHCSCYSFNGTAAVFLAMDEGGKTTAASLCSEGHMLSDDQNVFRRHTDGRWLAHGTPWTTFAPNPGSAVPGGFFLLKKADDFSLKRLGSKELFAFLWGEHYPVRITTPRPYQRKLLDLFSELSSSAPVYLMRFPRDFIDQKAILDCLKS